LGQKQKKNNEKETMPKTKENTAAQKKTVLYEVKRMKVHDPMTYKIVKNNWTGKWRSLLIAFLTPMILRSNL